MNASSIAIFIIISIILLSFGIFLISFLFFHNKKMIQNKNEIQTLELEKTKKTLVQAIEIQEEERSRIGADIHDDLGPTLSAIKLKINQIQASDNNKERNVAQLKDMVDETIKSVRGLSHSLYPNTLEKYGITNALNELGQRIDGDTIKATCDIDPIIEELPFYNQINIYRIIQEFCNNSIKHSGCNELNLLVQKVDENIEITISDNGKGFEKSKIEDGLGLKNMTMRAEAIDFTIKFDSILGQGTTLKLSNNPKN